MPLSGVGLSLSYIPCLALNLFMNLLGQRSSSSFLKKNILVMYFLSIQIYSSCGLACKSSGPRILKKIHPFFFCSPVFLLWNLTPLWTQTFFTFLEFLGSFLCCFEISQFHYFYFVYLLFFIYFGHFFIWKFISLHTTNIFCNFPPTISPFISSSRFIFMWLVFVGWWTSWSDPPLP